RGLPGGALQDILRLCDLRPPQEDLTLFEEPLRPRRGKASRSERRDRLLHVGQRRDRVLVGGEGLLRALPRPPGRGLRGLEVPRRDRALRGLEEGPPAREDEALELRVVAVAVRVLQGFEGELRGEDIVRDRLRA